MPRDAAALWRTACPLKQAPMRHGPPSAAEEVAELLADPPVVRWVKAFSENVTDGRETSEAFQQADHDSKRLEKLKDLLRRQVRGRLRRGELVGLGFAAPRAANAKPEPVPTDVWAGRIEWDKDTVEGNGIRFDGVRIAKAEPEASQRGPGRATLENEIVTAFDSLMASGRIDFSKSLTWHYPRIRETVLSMYPGIVSDPEEGMSPQTLQRHLGRRFKDAKAGQ